MDKSRSTEGSRSKDRTAITFVQISPHTCHVAYIVAYIIRNRGRITRVVFGDTGFHLSHKVGTYIGSFCIDTATYACKQCLRGSAHAESQHGSGNDAEFMGGSHYIFRNYSIQQQIPERYIKQAKANHYQSHHRTATESHA